MNRSQLRNLLNSLFLIGCLVACSFYPLHLLPRGPHGIPYRKLHLDGYQNS